jgi:hypothetical protein
MNTQSRGSRTAVHDPRLQRAIILQLLREDHPRKWTHTELAAELHAEQRAVDAAVRALDADGVVCGNEHEVWASRAALRLDELQLVAI